MLKFFISAGDPSGDIHAAGLINRLKNKIEKVEFIGLGGKKCEQEGLKTLVPLKEISVVGFWEVAKKYAFFLRLMKQCKEILSSGSIDAFIPVDYPGFNIPLAHHAKKKSVPVIYYIAPQLWAWGRNRAKKLSGSVDLLMTVFPFEKEYFNAFGLNTTFTGHPLLDDPVFEDIPPFEKREKRIAFLPGSRQQETEKHLPLLEKVSSLIKKKMPEYEIGIAVSSFVDDNIYKEYSGRNGWTLWDDSRLLMKTSASGVVKTGTSTLEAALCGMPFVMIYRTSSLSYLWGKRLLNLPYVAMPNILLNKETAREFIQHDFTPQNVMTELKRITGNRKIYEKKQRNFEIIRQMLGGSGAAEIAANEIISYLDIRHHEN